MRTGLGVLVVINFFGPVIRGRYGTSRNFLGGDRLYGTSHGVWVVGGVAFLGGKVLVVVVH
jgi:hypothetical protein